MNKCICFKHPTDILVENQKYTMSPVFRKIKKGDVFFYVLNREGTELFNFPQRMELYDLKDGRHLFSVPQNAFHKFFLDLVKYRENQIDHILDGVV